MKITLKEIRELTKDLPDETELNFLMSSGCCGDHETLEAWDLEKIEYKDENYIYFRFKALPGYMTCRQASATRDKK